MTTNNKETFFSHKEHYLAFRGEWAASVNSITAKSTTKPCDEWLTESDTFSQGTGTERVFGNITGAHHILYNILRGKKFDTGFSPVTNTNKLNNGAYINQGLYEGCRTLNNIISIAKEVDPSNYRADRLKNFLMVFNGMITPNMLKLVELPEVKAMTSDYGPYRKVAQHIIESNSNCKPTTFEHIEMILKEVA